MRPFRIQSKIASMNNENERNHEQTPEGSREKKGFRLNIHLVLLAVIILMMAVAGYRLLRWNKGHDSDYDPDAPQTTEFDTEPLDVYFVLTPDKLKDHPADGIDTILFLGNNVLTDGFFPDENGTIPSLIAEKTGAVVYNCGFPHSMTACDSKTYISTCPQDAFRLYYITDSLCKGDFSLQEEALKDLELDGDSAPIYPESLNLLSTLDINTVDTLVIFYDARDMLNYRPIEDPDGENSIATVCGALASSIERIQETYPFLRIVIMSPYHAYFKNNAGYYESLDNHNYGTGTLPNYLYSMTEVAQNYDVSLVDNYYGTINELSETKYLEDNIKLNNEGRELVADRLIRFLRLSVKP